MSNNQKELGLFIGLSFTPKAPNVVWYPTDIAKILSEAADRSTYMETVKLPFMPDPDTVHIRIEETKIIEYHQTFQNLTSGILDKIIKKGVKTILIFDFTYEPFYGETQTVWIHGYRPKRGCRGSWLYAAASIVTETGNRYFVDSFPIDCLHTDAEKALEKLFNNLPKQLMKQVKAVLLDRGFASEAVVKLLEARKLPYLILCPEWSTVKDAIRNTDGSYSRQEFKVGGTKTTLVLRKDDKKGFWWKFLTNMDFYHYARYVKEYRKRWNIETGFRVQDEARIKTKSTEITVRYFLFLVGMTLYNVWKEDDSGMPFKRFLMLNSLELLGVECVEACGPT